MLQSFGMIRKVRNIFPLYNTFVFWFNYLKFQLFCCYYGLVALKHVLPYAYFKLRRFCRMHILIDAVHNSWNISCRFQENGPQTVFSWRSTWKLIDTIPKSDDCQKKISVAYKFAHFFVWCFGIVIWNYINLMKVFWWLCV
jgi:hypothetical protein